MRPVVQAECTLKESAAINQILGRRVSVILMKKNKNINMMMMMMMMMTMMMMMLMMMMMRSNQWK